MSKSTPKAAAQAAGDAAEYVEITLRVPVARDIGERYCRETISMRLSATASRAYTRLFEGCQAAAARRGDGRYVNEHTHAINWLLEQIEAQLPAAGG